MNKKIICALILSISLTSLTSAHAQNIKVTSVPKLTKISNKTLTNIKINQNGLNVQILHNAEEGKKSTSFIIRTSEKVDLDKLNKNTVLIDGNGKEIAMEASFLNEFSGENSSKFTNVEYIIKPADYTYPTELKADMQYTLIIKKGLVSAINDKNVLKDDVKSIFHSIPESHYLDNYTNRINLKDGFYKVNGKTLRIIKKLNETGTKLQAENEIGEKYIINVFDYNSTRNSSPLQIGIQFLTDFYTTCYDKDGEKYIDMDKDSIDYCLMGIDINQKLVYVEPIYTTVKNIQGEETAALIINNSLYVIPGNQPIDKELIGATLPKETYYVTKANFANTELSENNIKGYVNVIFDNSVNKISPSFEYTTLSYEKMCQSFKGILNKEVNNTKTSYYITDTNGARYYVNAEQSPEQYFVYTNSKDFSLNKELEKEIGKEVIISGILKNNNEIIHSKVLDDLIEKEKNIGKHGIVGTARGSQILSIAGEKNEGNREVKLYEISDGRRYYTASSTRFTTTIDSNGNHTNSKTQLYGDNPIMTSYDEDGNIIIPYIDQNFGGGTQEQVDYSKAFVATDYLGKDKINATIIPSKDNITFKAKISRNLLINNTYYYLFRYEGDSYPSGIRY